MIDRNHPAIEAARRALAADDENGCMIEQHEGNGMWTCLAHGVSADGPEMCWYVRDMPPIVLNAAREHYTADDLRDTPAGQALMAEAKREVAYGLECLATCYDLSGHGEAARSSRAAAKSLLEAFPKEDNR